MALENPLNPILEEYLVLRFTDPVGDRHRYVGGSGICWSIIDARDYSKLTSKERVERFLDATENNRSAIADLEWVRVKRVQTFSRMDMNQDHLLEARRRRALAKLNADDISALDVEKFAIYDKLQNYNVEPDDVLGDDYDDDLEF